MPIFQPKLELELELEPDSTQFDSTQVQSSGFRAATAPRSAIAMQCALNLCNDTLYSILDTRYSILDTRYSILDTRYSIPDTRYSILDTRTSSKVTAPTNQQTIAPSSPTASQSGLNVYFAYFALLAPHRLGGS